ncbi:MAG TPA: VOC family protein [Candidatus Acidoferrales bacterium]|nr:VOC family protein [Candidatus Acidoferrales bacterium]
MKYKKRRNIARYAKPRLAGVELYFDDLEGATCFYRDGLGLPIRNKQKGHHTQFDAGASFICLEHNGAENYPSADKAVVFLQVPDLAAAISRIGREQIVRYEPSADARGGAWAVCLDPEGHNILLLQTKSSKARR